MSAVADSSDGYLHFLFLLESLEARSRIMIQKLQEEPNRDQQLLSNPCYSN